ncbi:hypothetical protein B296_00048216, partial [Ensete ventricosum]
RPCGVAVAGRARGWLPLTGYYPCGRPPLAGGLAAADRPLQVARPWSAAPLQGGLGCSWPPLASSQAMASHLYMQIACMWLPSPTGSAYFYC